VNCIDLPIKNFTQKDWILWIVSLLLIGISNILSPEFDIIILIAALVGATSLIFAAKGNGWAQILIVIFSILYGIISYRCHYWGEMITYLGMTMPMGIWSAIVWFKNPSEEKNDEVEIGYMNIKKWFVVFLMSIIVTISFYFILDYFDTPNILFSTISIATSFIAAALTIFRTSYYALFYAMNDLVLIVLWILAALDNPVYFPVTVNFSIFFFNDIYGFISWKKRENEKSSNL
jgi:nicotinamide mononucleotide transporter PnuC